MSKLAGALFHFFTQQQLAAIRGTRVGIAGAGGLGSNVAMLLARCGFADFVIADFDTVSAANLNRQFFFSEQIDEDKVDALEENLRRINDNFFIKTHCLKIEETNVARVFADCTVLVEAFDAPESKMMFVRTVRELWPERFLVTASGMAGWGNTDAMKTRTVGKNFVLVGDEDSSIDNAPPLAPRVMIAAAKQADAVLEFVLKNAVVSGQ